MRPLLATLLFAAACAVAPAPQSPPPIPAGEDPLRWQQDVLACAARPAPATHPVVFVGSSSIRLWKTLA